MKNMRSRDNDTCWNIARGLSGNVNGDQACFVAKPRQQNYWKHRLPTFRQHRREMTNVISNTERIPWSSRRKSRRRSDVRKQDSRWVRLDPRVEGLKHELRLTLSAWTCLVSTFKVSAWIASCLVGTLNVTTLVSSWAETAGAGENVLHHKRRSSIHRRHWSEKKFHKRRWRNVLQGWRRCKQVLHEMVQRTQRELENTHNGERWSCVK